VLITVATVAGAVLIVIATRGLKVTSKKARNR
jgi:hypothetical protein